VRKAEFYRLLWKARHRRVSRRGAAGRRYLRPGAGFKPRITVRHGLRPRYPTRRLR
jgi:hypothetical protein